MAKHMAALASTQPGYLGAESCRDPSGFGITVSYWGSEAAIAQRKQHSTHLVAQAQGQRTWYADFELRIAKVERAYGMHS